MLKYIRQYITLRLFMLMTLMLTVLFNVNTVRVIKDDLTVTFLGAEIISFIKLWVEMPMAALFLIIYIKLRNIFMFETVFQLITTVFTIFFTLFILIILPCPQIFCLDTLAIKKLIFSYPYFKFFIIMYAKWTFVIFYVICSIWPTIVYSVLFWQLMNKINRFQDAAIVYPLMNFSGQLSLLISGVAISFFSGHNKFLSKLRLIFPRQNEMMTIYALSCLVILTGMIILVILYFIKCSNTYSSGNYCSRKQEKTKLSMKESAQIILSSKNITYIFLLVTSYSLTINLIEGIWLAKAKEYYMDSGKFVNYQGRVILWTGISTLLCTATSAFTLKNNGWRCSALITPIISLAVGSVFFLLICFEDKLTITFSYYNFIAPIFLVVFFGALQNILIKGVKYSFFDITKEMAYFQLTHELKSSGKAAVEMLGARTGKLASVAFQCIILTISPETTYASIVLPLMLFFLLTCLLWIFTVFKLASLFTATEVLHNP